MTSLPRVSRAPRRLAYIAAGLSSLLLFSSCASALPEPEPERPSAAPEPVLSEDQLEQLLDEVEVHLVEGDVGMNPEDLGPRISGLAREVRTAEYLIEAADPARPITILPREESMLIVPATNDWPRDVVVVTQPPPESQIPRVLVLQQKSPRDNFSLTLWSQLLPGVSMPAMPLPSEGAQPLAGDATGLLLAPGEVGEAFTDVLAGKEDDDEDSRSGLFVEDPLSTEIRAEYDSLKEGLSAIGSVEKSFEVTEEPVVAFEALQGGAIVITAVQEITEFKIDSGSLNVASEAAAVLDKESIESELETVHDISLVFYIPEEDADEITILGQTRDLVEATGK